MTVNDGLLRARVVKEICIAALCDSLSESGSCGPGAEDEPGGPVGSPGAGTR